MLFLRMKAKERVKKFSEQLPDALDTMARSLRAGHPFTAAMNLASTDLADPMGTELGIVVDESRQSPTDVRFSRSCAKKPAAVRGLAAFSTKRSPRPAKAIRCPSSWFR